MSSWTEGIQNAIQYIEDNLTGELEIEDIAAKAYISPFYFQKIFNVLCGFTVSEYIRNRRLTLAAEELSTFDVKVIDAAMKYGYDSPDSFTRAFMKFHGISPSAAKKKGANIKSFAPLKIKLTLEGGTMIEYKIVEKASFTIMGKCRRFSVDTSYTEIPKFWAEHYSTGGGEIIKGMFGACVDGNDKDFNNGKEFNYFIADIYFPWNEIPDGCTTHTFSAGLWAVFPYHGECPKALQDVNTGIWTEWLPNCKEYELDGNYNLEFYIEKEHGEIWVPVRRIKN